MGKCPFSVFKSPLCKRKLCNVDQSVLSGDLAQPTKIYFLPWNVEAFTCIITLYLERTRSPYCLDLTHWASYSDSNLGHQSITRRMNTCNRISFYINYEDYCILILLLWFGSIALLVYHHVYDWVDACTFLLFWCPLPIELSCLASLFQTCLSFGSPFKMYHQVLMHSM